ncbi:DUF3489 domain-containing protein [Sphingomonas sp. SRS2]|uniref:DUF3489 domain-containing protein n=1 Tax=Sphingomonas sp. SRS2 TaxID=133190 RepID=UPI0006184410|nr:DUF3489 domain-containing protein [Sphingomonas sp. SRS2]KKC25456.1 hypothetical protein WP12_14450 [Sphingomonas sp. SRS2]
MAKTLHIDDLAGALLASAAKIENGMLLPPPAAIAKYDVLVREAAGLLIDRGLADEIEVTEPAMSWRADDTKLYGADLNDAGREVADTDGTSPPLPKKTAGKRDQVIALMKRREGASLAEITEATGWLPHSARAALSGLRKKGYEISRTNSDAGSVYRITKAPK